MNRFWLQDATETLLDTDMRPSGNEAVPVFVPRGLPEPFAEYKVSVLVGAQWEVVSSAEYPVGALFDNNAMHSGIEFQNWDIGMVVRSRRSGLVLTFNGEAFLTPHGTPHLFRRRTRLLGCPKELG